jgi:hydrogenase nickel incorporation protein HypA/HybF
MHELGLCTSIVDAVTRRAGERPVARVRVRVGMLQHVHPDAFDQSFTMAAQGTVAEGSTAELVLLPVQGLCASCASTWEGDDVPLICPRCGSTQVEVVGGDEVVLESIEYRA